MLGFHTHTQSIDGSAVCLKDGSVIVQSIVMYGAAAIRFCDVDDFSRMKAYVIMTSTPAELLHSLVHVLSRSFADVTRAFFVFVTCICFCLCGARHQL